MNQAEPEDGGPTADSAGHETTFEEIVAEWVAEGTVPAWPEAGQPDTDQSEASDIPASDPVPPLSPAPTPSSADYLVEFDEHFVPPEPPPMPRIGVTAAIGLVLLGFGIVLLVVPTVLGRAAELGLPLGLVSLALGLGWLVLRTWPSRAGRDDGDDGAVL